MKLKFNEVTPNPRPVTEWIANSENGAEIHVKDCGSMFMCTISQPVPNALSDSVTSYRDTREQALDAALRLARACGMVTE